MIEKIDHLGIAVKDLKAAMRLYAGLGLALDGEEEVPTEHVRSAFFRAGESHIELLESTTPDGAIARHIDKRGEGIHHIALQVEDIEQAMAAARLQGLQLLSEEPRPGAHGTRQVFIHPKSTGGVLIELVQAGGHGPGE